MDITDEQLKAVGKIIAEAKQLYNLSDAEYILLTQLAAKVSMFDYGCELRIKLF